MKKLLLLPLALLMLAQLAPAKQARADWKDWLNKVPNNHSVLYSMKDHEFGYALTTDFAKYKGFSLAGGYGFEDKIVGTISYNLLRLDKWIDFPILKWIVFEPQAYAGIGRIDKDSVAWSYGFGTKLVEAKW